MTIQKKPPKFWWLFYLISNKKIFQKQPNKVVIIGNLKTYFALVNNN